VRQLIVGNWKMNLTREVGVKLATDIAAAGTASCDLVLCPPFTLIHSLAEALRDSNIALGGQDCSKEASGAFTGDVAPPMLVDAGARYVILGHSERRQYHFETDADVRAKTEAAMRSGLVPLICMGETEAENRAGLAQSVVATRLDQGLPDGFNGIVSYEPIWAIGTGLVPSPQYVATMHDFIREKLVTRYGASGNERPILYGGSVKPSNADRLLAISNVNGALVGGASLVASEFLAIAKAARGEGSGEPNKASP